jgi:hypothetical protein
LGRITEEVHVGLLKAYLQPLPQELEKWMQVYLVIVYTIPSHG